MSKIKSIDTAYDKHLFRSRLEARWAVFFNTLEIEYRYELEGFDLGESGYYLPDFYLPGLQCWIEIKPDVELSREEKQKLRCFGDCVAPIICFKGLPSVSWNGIMYCQDVTVSGTGGSYEGSAGFEYCHLRQEAVISISDEDWMFRRGRRTLMTPQYKPFGIYPPGNGHVHTTGKIDRAATIARQARFEHGQVGPPSDWKSEDVSF